MYIRNWIVTSSINYDARKIFTWKEKRNSKSVQQCKRTKHKHERYGREWLEHFNINWAVSSEQNLKPNEWVH